VSRPIHRPWRFLFRAILAPLLFTLVGGEIFFRLPFAGKQIKSVFDPELGLRLAPSQSGSVWLANMSLLSPPMTLDSEGFRNPDASRRGPSVFCLGSSEAMGVGVADDEVWSSRLGGLLSASEGRPVRAVNGGNPGFGPFHCSVILGRALARRRYDLVVLRVSMGDRFPRPDSAELARYYRANLRSNRVKSVSLFASFLFQKARAQGIAIREIFRPGEDMRVYVRENETREAAARKFADESAWFDKMASLCAPGKVPLVFAIVDPVGTDAGRELLDRFKGRYEGNPLVHGLLVDNAAFGLDQKDPDARRKAFLEDFTLVADPHANARQHAAFARAVSDYIERERLLAPSPATPPGERAP
jgi:hypothetical protein